MCSHCCGMLSVCMQSYLSEWGRNSFSAATQPHCSQYFSDYKKKITFLCLSHVGHEVGIVLVITHGNNTWT